MTTRQNIFDITLSLSFSIVPSKIHTNESNFIGGQILFLTSENDNDASRIQVHKDKYTSIILPCMSTGVIYSKTSQ